MNKKRPFYRRTTLALFMLLCSFWGWGQTTTGTITISRASFPSGSLAYGLDDPWTVTSSTGEIITGNFDLFSAISQTTMQTRVTTPIGSHPYNLIAMPGPITKIVITGGATGTARAWTPYLSQMPLAKDTFSSSGISQGSQTATSNSASTTWDVLASQNFKYFYLNMTGGSAYLNSIEITYVKTPSFTLTYTAGENGTIVGTSPQTVQQGSISTPITAIPNTGYHFVNWSDGSITNPRIDVNVQANLNVTANFAINQYTVSYNENGATSGTVPVDAVPHNYGTSVTVLGAGDLAKTGFSFNGWNTSANGSGISYAAGATINSIGSNTTLYAQWLDYSMQPQTISFGALSNQTYGNAGFNLSATSSSGLPISYTSSDENVASVSGNTLTITGAGNTTITATQAGNENYQPAEPVAQTLTIVPKALSITGLAVTPKPYDGTTTATYTGGSLSGVVASDDVSFTGTVAFNDATVGENKAMTSNFTLTGAKHSNYTLNQPVLTGTINKADQSITDFVDLIKNNNDLPFTLPATTNAGQTVNYTSSNQNVATISGNTVTIVGIGTTTISATAAGNDNYNAFAGDVLLTVNFNETASPSATAATLVSMNGFTANWNAMTGAETYVVDVSESHPVATNLNEGFESGLPTSYTSGNVTLNGKQWSITDVIRGTERNSVSYSAQLRSATGSNIISPALNKVTKIDFYVKSSISGGSVQVNISTDGGSTWTNAPGSPFTGLTKTWTPISITLPTATTAPTLIQFRRAAGTIYIDDVIIDYTDSQLTPHSGSPYTVTAPATSVEVTGLSADTPYVYTVKAVNASITSAASNSVEVTTLAVPTWNGTAWNITPDATQPAIIDADYSGPAFESLSLTVNEGKTLTVNNYVKTGNVTNNGNIIVANNANFVQTETFTAGDNSSFKVRRDSKEVVRQAYINWSSPMKESTQTLKAFSYGKLADGVTNQSTTGTVDNRFYTYNNGGYVQVANLNTATFALPGNGYLIRTPNDFTTTPQVFQAQFEGKVPNSGDISFDHLALGGSFILLGNPYPSAISINDFWTRNPDTTGTVYIWNSSATMDEFGNYLGTNYNTYSLSGAVPAGTVNEYIPVGQGFFVDRTYIDPFVFTNSMRRTAESGIFSKGATTDRFWLEMKTPSGAKPQLLLAFNTAASIGYDQGYDAKMIDNNADVLYTTVDDKKLVIDAHGAFNETDSFSLDANFAQAGTYTINILQKEGIFSGSQKIFLKDNVTGTLTDLSAGAYSFNADPGVQTNRFSIAFTTDRTLGTDGTTKNSLTIFSTGKQVHLKADGKISNVEVYNMSGQLIASDKILAKEKTIAVPYTGVVLVKVQLENGTTSMKKLILQ